MKYPIKKTCILILAFVLAGCQKYLDAKSDKSLSVGASVKDIQALLDYNALFNGNCAEGEASSDNYFLTDQKWSGLYEEDDRNLYIWGNDLFTNTNNSNGWSISYQQVYYANVAIEKLNTIDRSDNADGWNNAMGQALFSRGKALFTVACTWAKVFDSSTADNTPGIPLRVNSDFNTVSQRSSLEMTLKQILSDLSNSVFYLPKSPIHVMRPSREAAYAMLARIYLYMGDYAKANGYADSTLAFHRELLDFNVLDPNKNYPIAQFNKEVIYSETGYLTPIDESFAAIDTSFYGQFSAHDLRKGIFFRAYSEMDKRIVFKGSYDGSANKFCGLAIDEVYLIKAECQLKMGNAMNALLFLNELSSKRYGAGFLPYRSNDKDEISGFIQQERRKELVMRNLRWYDLKRLNREGYNIWLRRKLNGKEYVLPPNSPRYALPIPAYVLKQSGMEQNGY